MINPMRYSYIPSSNLAYNYIDKVTKKIKFPLFKII